MHESSQLTSEPRRQIRVMFVVSNLEFGGAQRQIVELTNQLDPAEFDVRICSLSPYVPLAEHLREPERVEVVTKRIKFDATVVPRLAHVLRRRRIDVVQSYLFDADIAAFIAGRLARVSVVAGSERNADYVMKSRQVALYRLTRSLVDVVIANSHAGAAYNQRVVGHPSAKYHVVHNGVDTNRFRTADRAAARARLGLADGRPIVGMFASFKQQKNHPLFFRAAARVLAAFPDVRLLLVGDELYGGMHGSDVYKREVLELVERLALRERCIFAGNQQAVEGYYPACDVTVMSSHFEGTANAVLESMACGVPVVATDVSDTRAILPDGRAGYVVRAGDEVGMADRICALLADARLRAEMATAARAWTVEEFSVARLAEKTAGIYRLALAARGRRMSERPDVVTAEQRAASS
jgi:glycosyltransferase involved in cell wall biosynthesis